MKAESKTEVTLTLTADEAGLLSALADFPEWEAQPKHIDEFLSGLATVLDYAGAVNTARHAGFVGRTTVSPEGIQ